jgi:hypothetical protein
VARAVEPKTGRIYECNRADDTCKEKLCSLLVGRVHIQLLAISKHISAKLPFFSHNEEDENLFAIFTIKNPAGWCH